MQDQAEQLDKHLTTYNKEISNILENVEKYKIAME